MGWHWREQIWSCCRSRGAPGDCRPPGARAGPARRQPRTLPAACGTWVGAGQGQRRAARHAKRWPAEPSFDDEEGRALAESCTRRTTTSAKFHYLDRARQAILNTWFVLFAFTRRPHRGQVRGLQFKPRKLGRSTIHILPAEYLFAIDGSVNLRV